MTQTVHSLRKAGNKVMVLHKRRYFDPVNRRWELLTQYQRDLSAIPSFVTAEPRGGVTEIRLTTPSGVDIVAESRCSKNEGYNKALGVQIALGRALNELNFRDVSIAA